ncbi:MAG TPA: MoaD/ThiS family protein [Ktedonobacterales bacterium]|jgi:sulfur-carrier protein|nr:MoaD/ThiS family protein [Ktedonobacterales bacterium]
METASATTTVTVLLPQALATRVGDQLRAQVSGATLRDIIAALDEQRPGLRFSLCLETGELRPFVNVYVNGTHVRYLQWLDTPLPPSAVVHILPSVAGG